MGYINILCSDITLFIVIVEISSGLTIVHDIASLGSIQSRSRVRVRQSKYPFPFLEALSNSDIDLNVRIGLRDPSGDVRGECGGDSPLRPPGARRYFILIQSIAITAKISVVAKCRPGQSVVPPPKPRNAAAVFTFLFLRLPNSAAGWLLVGIFSSLRNRLWLNESESGPQTSGSLCMTILGIKMVLFFLRRYLLSKVHPLLPL